jgi:hypothetical protein
MSALVKPAAFKGYTFAEVSAIRECVELYDANVESTDQQLSVGYMLMELVFNDPTLNHNRVMCSRAYGRAKTIISEFDYKANICKKLIENISTLHVSQLVKILHYTLYTELPKEEITKASLEDLVAVACVSYGLYDTLFAVAPAPTATPKVTAAPTPIVTATATVTAKATPTVTATHTADTTHTPKATPTADTEYKFLTIDKSVSLSLEFLRNLQSFEKKGEHFTIVYRVMGINYGGLTKENIVASIIQARHIRKIYSMASSPIYKDPFADALLNDVFRRNGDLDTGVVASILNITNTHYSTFTKKDAFVNAVWSIINTRAE